MPEVKMIVMYPQPTDVEAFEKRYQEEHVPMAVEKLAGKTKLVATKVLGAPSGTPTFHRIAEVHFPSMDAERMRGVAGGTGNACTRRRYFNGGAASRARRRGTNLYVLTPRGRLPLPLT